MSEYFLILNAFESYETEHRNRADGNMGWR